MHPVVPSPPGLNGTTVVVTVSLSLDTASPCMPPGVSISVVTSPTIKCYNS